MSNPEFYDRQRRRQSTWNIPRFIQSFDETLDGHLVLPRGLLDTVARVISEAGSKTEIDDQRSGGAQIGVTLTVELTSAQRVAVEKATPHDLGVLVAPPGAGKTVMACAAIAAHAVSTLVLVDRNTLADQWRSQLHSLLGVKPGQLGGGRSKLTGIVDVATLQTPRAARSGRQARRVRPRRRRRMPPHPRRRLRGRRSHHSGPSLARPHRHAVPPRPTE